MSVPSFVKASSFVIFSLSHAALVPTSQYDMGSLGRKSQGKTREAWSSFSLLAPPVRAFAIFQLFFPCPSPGVGIECSLFVGRGLGEPVRCLFFGCVLLKLLLSSSRNEVRDNFPRLVTLLVLSDL